jgi:hypothetical protein
VGSRSNEYIAYIAGFIDGDGSLMLQVKKRSDSSRGLRFMATICLYQDTRHDEHLHWMKEFLEAGYISVRNDGMTELRIQGYKVVYDTLLLLKPYLRFKSVQCEALMHACELLINTPLKHITDGNLKQIIHCVVQIQSMNYVTKKKRSREELYDLFGLTP